MIELFRKMWMIVIRIDRFGRIRIGRVVSDLGKREWRPRTGNSSSAAPSVEIGMGFGMRERRRRRIARIL